jgi:3-oxoacyl-[acyl-carrier-protein] synthase II
MPSKSNGTRPLQGRRVVITGIGAVSPNGVGREAFWTATRTGVSGIKAIAEFDASHLPTRIAGICTAFEPGRHISANELKHVPRLVPMALAASAEALEDAGVQASDLPLEERRRFGVALGSGGGGLEFIEKQFRQYYLDDPKGVSLYTIPSSTPGTLASELSMRFALRGASHVISTGCTSSTDALGHAMSMIRYGRADRMLAGGSDSPISVGILTGFCLMRIMSTAWNDEPERASRPFSKDRDGFVLSEGSWMFLLEDLDTAKARGARIYGELVGYGATCEAFHRVRLDENGEEPARAMQLALEDAGVSPGDVDHLNLHGTSTQMNDRIETRAVKAVFGARATTIPCSATKSVLGHPQGACGSASVAATLLAMRDSYLHPTINQDEADPDCDLDVVPNVGRERRFDTALCNCIGFGSKNAALVLRRVID